MEGKITRKVAVEVVVKHDELITMIESCTAVELVSVLASVTNTIIDDLERIREIGGNLCDQAIDRIHDRATLLSVMTKRLPTNAEVDRHGHLVDDWPCDVDAETGEMQSNGGREGIYVMPDGRRYMVITPMGGGTPLRPDLPACQVDKQGHPIGQQWCTSCCQEIEQTPHTCPGPPEHREEPL